jgi:hypothetical protein
MEEEKQTVHLAAGRGQIKNACKGSSSIAANLVGKFVTGGMLKTGEAYLGAVHDAYSLRVCDFYTEMPR